MKLASRTNHFVNRDQGTIRDMLFDANKIKNELGRQRLVTFEQGLEKTVNWFLSNEIWLNNVTSGNYQNYYQEQYK